jgi:hypothetical protein
MEMNMEFKTFCTSAEGHKKNRRYSINIKTSRKQDSQP